MLMTHRSARISATVEDRKMLTLQTVKYTPQSAQIRETERRLLRLEVYCMNHELRTHDAKLVQYELVVGSDEA